MRIGAGRVPGEPLDLLQLHGHDAVDRHAHAGAGGFVNGDPVTGGGPSTEGAGGTGSAAGNGDGGGLFNAGTASFTGVTVTFTSNQAASGNGGAGGAAAGGVAQGSATGGDGGDGGEGASGVGGGIFNATTGTLTLEPRLGAKKGSKQAKATDLITTNQALAGSGGQGGAGGSATAGGGISPFGIHGVATPGQPGATDLFSVGVGGGIANFGTVHIDNTIITGNHASTNDNDVDGTITP